MAGWNDPLNFTIAEDYFNEAKHWGGPKSVNEVLGAPPENIINKDYWRGVTLKFDDNTLAVIQFIRPTLWRVRYDPSVKSLNDYGDQNSRTIIGNSTSQLIADLDGYEQKTWMSHLSDLQDGSYWTFSSKVTNDGNEGSPSGPGNGMRLYLYKSPFRIQAVRTLTPVDELHPIIALANIASAVKDKVVWQTSEKTFRHKLHPNYPMLKDVVLDVIKAGPGEFIGWGEQGGTGFMKKPTFMNYFNMDNMRYEQVYGVGPLDPREPLYHSDPYWLDVNSNPEHKNVTATFVDNYSQIAVDFGKTNSGYLKIGTRFNAMDVYLITADTVPEIVKLHTSIIGRSALKPRYILGNHQACYGYTRTQHLYDVTDGYRRAKIPLDGLHIDVDLQNNYRTFTTNPTNFPQPQEMFRNLALMGVKCSTNITPVINLNPLPNKGYKALEEGLKKEYFIMENRYTNQLPKDPNEIQYVHYESKNKSTIRASDNSKRQIFINDDGVPARDDYEFATNYNSKYPYHGGVWYGGKNGTAGYYPDLNRLEVRKWWGTLYEDLFKAGLEFVWQDMTTPAIESAYGDMNGLPSRLNINSDAVKSVHKQQLAIEIWALYSYNLHKATFHGLNNLKCREGKRNFILGRGSFAGMFRFAGLWSGDNVSTWDFWRITIPQVLSMGLNGVCITGSDTGGFEPNDDHQCCDPELLIRWYAGSFLLPWLRNHYNRKPDDNGRLKKYFQEPFEYPKHFDNNRQFLTNQGWLYYGALHVTQYFIQLRYSLLQLLYDTMFANQIDGMPIARSMILTDTQDTSFFNESQDFLDNQYVVGQDLLIAPIMYSRTDKGHEGQNRDVYLPLCYFWYPSNLRPWDWQGVALGPAVEGGSVINYYAGIPEYPDDQCGQADRNGYPNVTPIYIREGGIIPQIEVRDFVEIGDERKANPIKFNIYPIRQMGKPLKSEYTTYLDDGVSRNSAPTDVARFRQLKMDAGRKESQFINVDGEAGDKYRAVTISQTTVDSTRTITITKKQKETDYNPNREIGSHYTVILWYDEGTIVGDYSVITTPDVATIIHQDRVLRTVVVTVQETLGDSDNIVIKVVPSKR